MSSSRFIKFIQSEKSEWLQQNYPAAFLLLCVLARRARRFKDELSGFEPGDAIIGREEGSKAAGITINQFRKALEDLEKFSYAKVVYHPKFKNCQKRTIKITIKSLVVNICNSDIFDINENDNHHQNHHLTTISPPSDHHKQERIRKKKTEKDKKIFSSDSAEIGLAELLFAKISSFLENPKLPDFQNWAAQMDFMIRIDKRDAVDIRNMIEWLYSSGPIFWRKNILSPAKLREKWDRLKLEKKPIEGKISNFEFVSAKFHHGKFYNGAECFINDDSISFQRGMNHRTIRFKELGFKEQLNNLLHSFGIEKI